jgi:hypothetical protein
LYSASVILDAICGRSRDSEIFAEATIFSIRSEVSGVADMVINLLKQYIKSWMIIHPG